MGASTDIDERGEMDFEVLEGLIGKVEDVLGSIPKEEELGALEEIKKDLQEAEALAHEAR